MKQTLSALKDYQVILTRITYLEKQLALVPPEIKKLEKIWKDLTNQVTKSESEIEETGVQKHEYEVKLAEQKIKHEKFERDLSEVTNDKEYNAVLREIDNAKKEISRFELGIKECSQTVIECQSNIEELGTQGKEAEKHYNKELKRFRKGQSEGSKELEKLKKNRVKAEDSVPKGMLSKFNRIAERRNGVGLAFCQNAICKSCNVRVRHHIVEQLRTRDKMLQCESCRRILYYQDVEPEPGS